jgi:hypothetical protein
LAIAFAECFVRGLAIEGAVRPCEVVELFPIGELLFQVHVIGIVEELIEFLLVGPVRPFNFAVELRAW